MADRNPLPPMRRSWAFCFLGGNLTVREEGDGWFTFDEDDVQWHPHDEREGCYLLASLPQSELIALRDFLNEHVKDGVSLPEPITPDPNANALQRLMDRERQSTIAYGARVSVGGRDG